jgi:outer membrane protein assembly factor BamA
MVGFDARHYIPLLEHSILALRATSAFSFGTKKNIYYLGGVNNSLFNSFENAVPLPQGDDFAFKTNVPHLRGFGNNIRNGSKYVLANSELRIPLFRYFLGKERGSSFFRNFQLIAFADAGLAWYGASPNSKENPLNIVYVDDVLVDLEIQYFRDPIVFGYGYGIRTFLMGYMLKFDLGYGVETKRVLSPKLHFSLGKDF